MPKRSPSGARLATLLLGLALAWLVRWPDPTPSPTPTAAGCPPVLWPLVPLVTHPRLGR